MTNELLNYASIFLNTKRATRNLVWYIMTNLLIQKRSTMMLYLRLALGILACSSIALFCHATPVSKMREFIAITDTMAQNGIRIGTTLSKDKHEKLGLLLEIDPSNLMLIPDNFELRKVKTRPAIELDRVVSIADKLRQMKLICRNETLHRKFPEWGIMELCHEESVKIFADYMSNVFKNKDRLAITVRDLESVPIVELGRLRCRRLHGPCLTPRPREEELEAVS